MLKHPTDRRTWLQRAAGCAGLLVMNGCAPGRAGAADPKSEANGDARVSEPAAIRGQNYRLSQNWDFRNTIRDTKRLRELFYTRYIYNNGTQDALNDEWQRYRDNDNHVFEKDGLALVARAPGDVARGKIESGMLRSKWSGEYGYFECRVKVPAGRGHWPAFWLNPQDGKWPPEIDILEIVNNGRDTTRKSFHFVHSGSKEKMTTFGSMLNSNQNYAPGFDYADDFHTFAAEWSQDRVRHYVDDVLVVDRAFHWVHPDGSDGGPAHVLLNLAVGGSWPGPPEAAALPAKMVIDFVRIWQK